LPNTFHQEKDKCFFPSSSQYIGSICKKHTCAR
jgi:hypothetical protein